VTVRILTGDCRETLPTLADASVQCCVTSPPYWGRRDYGVDGQLGLERTPEEYVANIVGVFREVRRVLRDDGTLWLNIGDSYANDGKRRGSTGGKHARGLHGETGVGRGKKHTGLKPKDLVGIPWMTAFALRADGWYLRSDIIWHKPNPMPESVTDRPGKSHEYVFMLSKSLRYFYNADAVRRPDQGRDHKRNIVAPIASAVPNASPHRGLRTAHGRDGDGAHLRSVWTIPTQPTTNAHFATFPPALVEPCILAGSRPGDVALDPFGGTFTTAAVATTNGRDSIVCELNPAYVEMGRDRLGLFAPAREATR
jgi:DNA modification methylase